MSVIREADLEKAAATFRIAHRRAVEDGNRALEARLRPVDREIMMAFPNVSADEPAAEEKPKRARTSAPKRRAKRA